MVAVIMAARRASQWIHEAIASVHAQRDILVDLRIGVDACTATADVLRARGVPFWWSPKRVGPYLIRNALISQSGPDVTHFSIFDADDVMREGYLRRMVDAAGPEGLSGCAALSWSDVSPIPDACGDLPVKPYKGGQTTISRAAWDRLGGFRPWRIVSDSDLLLRAKALGIPVTVVSTPLYVRRLHPQSQTANPETGHHSSLRKRLKAEMRAALAEGQCVVPIECVPLEMGG